MSRFNALYLGTAEEAAAALVDDDGSVDELRVALINALLKIDALEKKVTKLTSTEQREA